MLTPEEIAEAKALWAEGFNTSEIAETLGVEERIVYNSRPYLDADYLALPGTIRVEPKRNISAPKPVVITPVFGQK